MRNKPQKKEINTKSFVYAKIKAVSSKQRKINVYYVSCRKKAKNVFLFNTQSAFFAAQDNACLMQGRRYVRKFLLEKNSNF